MEKIIIGTRNPHKRKKLSAMVAGSFDAVLDPELPDVEEHGLTFEETARNKAMEYSKLFGGWAISTDGGAVFPALKDEWDPLRTRRFGNSDEERIATLLEMLRGKDNRTVEWHEAIALAKDGEVIFSTTVRAMDGVIDEAFDPKKYVEGIWLCSITSFPQFGGRNFFDLTEQERELTEDSWEKLEGSLHAFLARG